MRKLIGAAAVVAAGVGMFVSPASATIHPIVESFDCANEQAFAHHPLGDPADPPGQTPGENHADQSTLRAIERANANAFSDHKLNAQCGKVGQ